MIIKCFKVYGRDGHRQKESFCKSHSFTDWDGVKISVFNSDLTGTNEYSVLMIQAETSELIHLSLMGQISDGVFENCSTGRVVECNII